MRLIIFLFLLIVLSIASLFVGVEEVSLFGLWSKEGSDILIFYVSRMPRTAALLLAGIGISISGLIMQQITQNKFVSPTTAGTLDAAKLGILGGLLLFPTSNPIYKILLAFTVTFISNIVFIKIATKIRYKNVIFIPIIGIIYGGIIYSITAFFGFQFNIIQDIGSAQDGSGSWMMGDFSSVLRGKYELLYLILPVVILTYFYANKFTLIGIGDSFAKNLGINYEAIMMLGIFCVSLTISAVAVTVGIIPFLGLVIPNIVSILFGDNLKKTLPLTALSGAIFLIFCDIISRIIIFPYEIPIGMTVGLLGGVIFFIILIKKRL